MAKLSIAWCPAQYCQICCGDRKKVKWKYQFCKPQIWKNILPVNTLSHKRHYHDWKPRHTVLRANTAVKSLQNVQVVNDCKNQLHIAWKGSNSKPCEAWIYTENIFSSKKKYAWIKFIKSKEKILGIRKLCNIRSSVRTKGNESQ